MKSLGTDSEVASELDVYGEEMDVENFLDEYENIELDI